MKFIWFNAYVMIRHLVLFLFIPFICACTNPPDAEEIIERSISYHDPYETWSDYSGYMEFEESRPSGPTRNTTIWIDNTQGYFKINRNDMEIHGMLQDSCFVELGEISCHRANTMRNYYLYLWGLPMKLKDPGTKILPGIEESVVEGQPVYVVGVDYEQDSWNFYFHKDTYALLAYKFVKPDGSGEYILPDGVQTVDQMRLPTNRSWYTLDSTFLGLDKLVNSGEI